MASSSLFLECDSTLNLGFVEKTPGWLLASRFFPCKVGGKPAWLDLKDLPTSEETSCQKCGNPLIFLLQIYANLNYDPKCFHRSIFVFMCSDSSCHQTQDSSPFKVFRSQLSRENEYYPYENPVESPDWKPELNVSKFGKLKICRVCGCPGTKKCSGCGKVSYCSKNHQTMDWKARHKDECKDSNFEYSYQEDEKILSSLLLPQHEIIIQGDDESVSDSDDEEEVDEKKELEKIQELEKSGKVMSVKDLEDFSTEDEDLVTQDKNLKRFQKVVKCASDQVIRFQRTGNPLWISTNNVPGEDQIPNCEDCGSKRVFEFQIMPQLLDYLKLNKSVDERMGPEKSIDWGILAVYTCEKSCGSNENESKAYKSEFIWKQDL